MAAHVKVARSCLICHKRKVRCDKLLPCSTCVRGGVLCCYPSDDKPAAPRQSRSNVASISARLQQLERTIAVISSDIGSGTANQSQSRRLIDSGEAAQSAAAQEQGPGSEGMLLQSGQYINEILLSRVLEEEEDIRSVISSSHDSAEQSQYSVTSLQPFSFSFNTWHPFNAIKLRELHPADWQATQMWQHFTTNVDAFSKVIHVPTEQVGFFTALAALEDATPDVNCLMFAIYFSATTSLWPEEVQSLLGMEKKEALARFKLGLELSLNRANILETPTIRGLQALSIFLRSVRAHGFTRSSWILHGVATRAGQSIGLHRDASHFKKQMSPFEAEMRRRLWWHIWSHDGRAAEDMGIVMSDSDWPASDTRLPLNVEDSMLDPAMTELPPPQKGWTHITLTLSMLEAKKKAAEMHRLLLDKAPASPQSKREQAEKILDDVRAATEPYLQCYNPIIPLQRANAINTRLVMSKFILISRVQILNATEPQPGSSPNLGAATDENLAIGCEILELNLQFQTDGLLRNYVWVAESYPQYHLLLFVLWHLCVRPTGPLVDRAWADVEGSFEIERSRLKRQGQSHSGTQWAMIAALRDKAARIRGGGPPSVKGAPPASAAATETTETESGASTEHASSASHTSGGDEMSWDGILDWNELVTDFDAQDLDMLGA